MFGVVSSFQHYYLIQHDIQPITFTKQNVKPIIASKSKLSIPSYISVRTVLNPWYETSRGVPSTPRIKKSEPWKI